MHTKFFRKTEEEIAKFSLIALTRSIIVSQISELIFKNSVNSYKNHKFKLSLTHVEHTQFIKYTIRST